MRRALAAVALALVGCGGDDVVLTPASVRAQNEALACGVQTSTTDGDVCFRPLDTVTSHTDELRRTLVALKVLSDAEREIDDDLFQACQGIRSWCGDDWAQYEEHAVLGQTGYGITTEDACRRAIDAWKKTLPSINYAGVSVTRGPCHDPPSSSSCFDGAMPTRQCVESLTVQIDSAGARDDLEQLLKPIFDAESLLDVLPNVVPSIGSPPSDLAPGCDSELEQETAATTQQIGASASISADLTAALAAH